MMAALNSSETSVNIHYTTRRCDNLKSRTVDKATNSLNLSGCNNFSYYYNISRKALMLQHKSLFSRIDCKVLVDLKKRTIFHWCYSARCDALRWTRQNFLQIPTRNKIDLFLYHIIYKISLAESPPLGKPLRGLPDGCWRARRGWNSFQNGLRPVSIILWVLQTQGERNQIFPEGRTKQSKPQSHCSQQVPPKRRVRTTNRNIYLKTKLALYNKLIINIKL